MTSLNDIERRLDKLEDDATKLRRKWPISGDFDSAFPERDGNAVNAATAADSALAFGQIAKIPEHSAVKRSPRERRPDE